MRWKLAGDWPINGGLWMIPNGTVLEGTSPSWNGHPCPWPLPLGAVPLDAKAAELSLQWHAGQQHLLFFGPGIDRAGMLRRHEKRRRGERI